MYFLDNYSPPMTLDSMKALLSLCFQHCDHFSLTHQNWPWTNNALRDELAPYLCHEILTTRWFSYGTTEANPLKIFLYSANSDTKVAVEKSYHGLFLDNLSDETLRWEHSLEDLCFFSKSKLFFGTVSHEYDCRVYPPNEEFKAKLLEIYSHWKTQDDDSEQICLSDYCQP